MAAALFIPEFFHPTLGGATEEKGCWSDLWFRFAPWDFLVFCCSQEQCSSSVFIVDPCSQNHRTTGKRTFKQKNAKMLV